MDRISRQRVSTLVASGSHLYFFAGHLQLTLGQFTAKCEVLVMRISTCKSKAMVLSGEEGGVPGMSGCPKWRSLSILESCLCVREE